MILESGNVKFVRQQVAIAKVRDLNCLLPFCMYQTLFHFLRKILKALPARKDVR